MERRKVVWLKCYMGDNYVLCQEATDNMGMYPSCIFLAAFQEEICTPMLSVLRFLSFYSYALTVRGEKKILLRVIWGSSQFPALSAGRMPAPGVVQSLARAQLLEEEEVLVLGDPTENLEFLCR